MAKKDKDEKNIERISFLDCKDGRLLELIGEKDNHDSLMFAKYNVLEESVDIIEKIELGNTIYLPPKDALVRSGTILLPSYPNEYGNIAQLTEEIGKFIYRYLDISDSYRKIATYYVLLSWVYDCFDAIPYLRPLGDYGTGKTRFQKVIGSICYKPMFAGGATTPSPIFRIIDLYHGTLIIDEADFRYSDKRSDVIKILNCGYTKGLPVLRTEGEKWRTPTSYNVYCPKIIGTRERFGDQALESRCLTEIMQGNPRPDIPIHLPKKFYKETLFLRNLLLMFRFKHYGRIELKPELALDGVEPRINEVLLPLMSIIDEENILDEIKEFARNYANQLRVARGQELPAEILRVMVSMVEEDEVLQHKKIAERINESRSESSGERKISPAKVGRINSSHFDFKKKQVKGLTQFIWDTEKAKKLCTRYGIDYLSEDSAREGGEEEENLDNFKGGEEEDYPFVDFTADALVSG